MAPRTPMASLFPSSSDRLKSAPAALKRASSSSSSSVIVLLQVELNLRASTRGGTAPDLTMVTSLGGGSMERLTRAAVALIRRDGEVRVVDGEMRGRRAARILGVQSEVLQSGLSLVERLRAITPDSLTEI